MVELFTEKIECCGCGACMNVCSKEAISMKKDEYGFVYPRINMEKCIGCGACKKVCAFQSNTIKNKPQKVYAIASKNNNIVKKSASGGLFATMATYVLEQGGYVYGAVMKQKEHELHICHVCCDAKENLHSLQGSKYVQSSLNMIFRDVQMRLKSNSLILFSGTPCQVDALKSYLKKDYKNLITVDIVCHGVPNEQFFNDYIHYLEKKIGGEIIDFKFRDKSSGWGYNLTAEYIREDGDTEYYKMSSSDSSYFDMFISSIVLRENCYQCKYANEKRAGDITIGDYWGVEDEHPEILQQNGGSLSEQSGISVMMLNNEKGINFFNNIKAQFDYYESTFEKAAKKNTQLTCPVKFTKERKKVLDMYKNRGYGAVEFYFLYRIQKQKVKCIIRRILPKVIRQKIKQTLYK